MPMTIYKLFGNAVGDSTASLDIQIDGIITSINMSMLAGGVNLIDEGASAEVSFLSSSTFTVNDVRGSLMMCHTRSGLLTSGALQTAVNISVSSLEIPVAAGERIHLHLIDIGTVSARQCTSYIYVLDKGTPRIPGRRR